MRNRLLLLALMPLVARCTPPFPVRPGESLTYSRCEAPIAPEAPGFDRTLQIRWLGTTCHHIQLGPVAVLTDPYFTHHRPSRVAFGEIPSDSASVHRFTSDLSTPDAIFIGHAHYDHMLDLAEVIRQRSWTSVPVYGGPTVGHIAAGYGEAIEQHFHVPEVSSEWTAVNPSLSYRAFPAQHADHLPGIFFFPGALKEARTTPPTRARHFPVGETFTYLFRLRNEGAAFTIFIADAATDGTVGIPDDLSEGVDVAILCVPAWRHVDDYPAEAIRRLRPRVIVLSHLDNFLQDGWKKREVVATADLEGFLDKARGVCDYPGFERLIITDVGGTVRVLPRPQ